MSIYENPRLRASLTHAACDEIRQRYSADKHASTIVELYQSICRRQVQ
jgi:hypothetical protein